MIAILCLALHVLISPFKTRARLEEEIVMLRHQLHVLRRRVPWKPKMSVTDRLLFVWLNRLFPSVLNAVTFVQPETLNGVEAVGFQLRSLRHHRRSDSLSRLGGPT